MTPTHPPARFPVVMGAAFALVLMGCRGQEEPSGAASALESYFHRVGSLRVAPIEPFRALPASLAALPDGRIVLPEAGGVWIHVVGPDGRGLTRLGGASTAPLGALETPAGKFSSLSGVAVTPEGRLLAADQTSDIVSVFNEALEPETTITVPRARNVWQIEALPGGRLAAAVAPRHPTAGGQVVLFSLGEPVGGDSAATYLPQEPFFRHNRWQPISSTRLETLADGRILAYWAPLPWARLLSAPGDSLPPIGSFSRRYKAPSSGPSEQAPFELLSAWFDSFTPLVGVEAVDSVLVFQFLALEGAGQADDAAWPGAAGPGTADARRGAGRAGGGREAAPGASDRQRPARGTESRRVFVNLYDGRGRPLAKDLLLPAGSRILKSNDRSRLYLLRRASPRELEIELWEPDPELRGSDRLSSPPPALPGHSRSGSAAGRSRAARSGAG